MDIRRVNHCLRIVLQEKYHNLIHRYINDLHSIYGWDLVAKNNYQNGGQKIKKFEYMDKVYSFPFDIVEEDNLIIISVTSTTDQDCALLTVDRKREEAILTNMTYHKNCALEGPEGTGGGAVLLNFLLSYLKVNKKKLKVSKVFLTDNSFLQCPKSGGSVKLSRLRVITKGNTYYGKHGFVPVDPKIIEYNNRILNELKTSQVPVIKYALEGQKKEQIDSIDMDELTRLVLKYSKFRDFIIRLSCEYSKYCDILAYLLETVYASPKPNRVILNDPFGKVYVQKI